MAETVSSSDAAPNEDRFQSVYYKELNTLLRFSALLNSSLDMEAVLDIAMKWAEEFADAEASSIFELDEETGLLSIRYARGEKKEYVKGLTLRVGEGIAGSVVETGKPMVVQDVNQEARFSDRFDRFTGFRTRSMVCVPLILRDKTIGALQVLNKRSGGLFAAHDLELLTSMGQLIAIAMENARLYRRLEEKFELTAKELKATEEKLIRSERLSALGRLVQGLAHEIRNPVMSIGGFAQRIKKELPERSKAAKYLDIVLSETALLEKLVSEVHKYVESQSAVFAPADLLALVEVVLSEIEPSARAHGVEIVKETPQGSLVGETDAGQIETALHHVIENALEAMPLGGTLSVRVTAEGPYLSISIADTGCGIETERLENVYDPFVTSKTRGIGLGLTLVHQIVMNHNGEMDIHSELNSGTSVTIRLPVLAD